MSNDGLPGQTRPTTGALYCFLPSPTWPRPTPPASPCCCLLALLVHFLLEAQELGLGLRVQLHLQAEAAWRRVGIARR